ncbi:MAG: ABC transporter permease [Acidimicrobiales bacterium]
MSFLADVVGWFTTAAHWRGENGIPHRLSEHLLLSALCVLVAAAVALPIGMGLGHLGRGGAVAVNLANVGRAIPSFAILVLATEVVGIGARPAFVALVALALPPMVTNSYVGVREVDPEVREAARGMGMTGAQVLRRVEAPLALPLVLAGVRTAAVQVVATATLAALVAWGGLGRYIVDGLSQRDFVQVFAGAVLVAAVATLTEVVLAALERAVTPFRHDGPTSGKTGADVAAAT